MVMAVATYVRIKSMEFEGQVLVKRLMLFPFILFVTGLFATADLIYNDIHPRNQIFWLDVVGLVFLSLFGLMNSVVFVLPYVGLWVQSPHPRENCDLVERCHKSGTVEGDFEDH